MANKTKKETQRGSEEAKQLGRVVRQMRHALGLTQARLGEAACGLDQKYIGLVESGGTNISLPNLLKLAVGLEMSAGDLLNAAFPAKEREGLEQPLLLELMALVRDEDLPTLELLQAMLREIKTWEEARSPRRSRASSEP